MKKLTTAFLAIALIAVGAIFVFAQKADGDKGNFRRGFGHHRGGFGRLAKQLNLTDAQKAQMKQIREASKAKTQPLRESMKSIHQQMAAATADGNFNEAQVQTLATQQANIMAQLTVERETHEITNLCDFNARTANTSQSVERTDERTLQK